jgi:MgtC family protein
VTLEPQSVIGIAIAALGGAAVGLEREWSGHAGGPEAHFAGIRTFTLLGGLAGIAGWLWPLGFQPVAIVLLAGASALVVAAYLAASRRVIDGTTEVAALVVLSPESWQELATLCWPAPSPPSLRFFW